MSRIPVYLHASDPISRAGVASQLRPRPEVLLVEDGQVERTTVAVVVTEAVSTDALDVLRSLRCRGIGQLVLVATDIKDAELAAVAEVGVAGMIRRTEASPDRLVAVIRAAAAGDGSVPPDLLGRLLAQVGALQRGVLSPRRLTFTGLTEREAEILRLVAAGLGTAEIAEKLSYSPRTVKNALHDVTTRLHLRNRSHAVAYALRNGLI
ncbi:MAG TPA: response regulator transcription factor [Pilimelia sp.]|nr:response regulator transcription factor [Pilimelia sp.]